MCSCIIILMCVVLLLLCTYMCNGLVWSLFMCAKPTSNMLAIFWAFIMWACMCEGICMLYAFLVYMCMWTLVCVYYCVTTFLLLQNVLQTMKQCNGISYTAHCTLCLFIMWYCCRMYWSLSDLLSSCNGTSKWMIAEHHQAYCMSCARAN